MNKEEHQIVINEPLSSKYDSTISLLNVYFSEWSHRDQILWTQTFRFYYAALIVILLPNISKPLKIDLPPIPKLLYRSIGLLISIIFLYVSLGYAVRLHIISKSYRLILDKLPEEYKQKNFDNFDTKGIKIAKLFKPRLAYLVCITLFLSLFLLSLLLIIVDANLLF